MTENDVGLLSYKHSRQVHWDNITLKMDSWTDWSQAYYKRLVEIYRFLAPRGKLRWARRCRLFADFLGNNQSHVLEIGCGTGLFTKELARTDNTIVAIDILETLIMKAKERVSSANLSFIVGNAYETEFKSESFDFIVSSSALHHLEVDSALKEFSRILRSGGRVMFTEPNMMNPQVALIKNLPFIKRRAGESPDETAFFRWQIANQLRLHGFVDVYRKAI